MKFRSCAFPNQEGHMNKIHSKKTFAEYILTYFIAQTSLWCTIYKVYTHVLLYKIHLDEQ